MDPAPDALASTIHALPDKILEIRGQRVLLDADLAGLFGVPTKRFNEQVGRNLEKFPSDFMFVLTKQEIMNLRSHFATTSGGHGGRRYNPRAFTEHGAIMAATVLNSPRAVEMSVYIVRAFVRFREMLSSHRELSAKLGELESRLDDHDQAIGGLIRAIKALMEPEAPRKRPIGYIRDSGD